MLGMTEVQVPISNENGDKFDSGLRKLGAIIGDGAQLGCNVVTNPGMHYLSRKDDQS